MSNHHLVALLGVSKSGPTACINRVGRPFLVSPSHHGCFAVETVFSSHAGRHNSISSFLARLEGCANF